MLECILQALSKLLLIQVPRNLTPVVPSELAVNTQFRQGLSTIKTTNKLLARKRELGLPTGNFEDNTANFDDIMLKETVDAIFQAMQTEARVTVGVQPGQLVNGSGVGNLGGPIAVAASTTSFGRGGATIQ